ncbi:MAG: hypothetical protein V1734_02185, partial [Nanoarchaeota archaeon]
MQVLKTLKRVAAIGTGVAMLGATLTGALALDLKDYPKPFVVDGVYDDSNVFVYGDTAIAADTVAISDITSGLQFLAKTPVVTSGTTVSGTGLKAAQVPLGQGFTNATFFDKLLQDDDISTLFDGKINFRSSDYDTSEELQMCDVNYPYLATGLMTAEDDYKTDVFMELVKDKIKYAYKFDKSIQLNLTSTTNPLEIEFLGKKLKITAIDSATSFTATVGDEYSMNAGDSVTVNGKTVKLKNVGTSNAEVEVDGVAKSISTSVTASVNGLDIYVESVTNRNTLAESSAILVIGKDARQTYSDGDAYLGEDEDDPMWVWDLAALNGAAGTSSYTDCSGADALVLRVENDFEFADKGDSPTGVGQCIELPNKYLSICFDSLSVTDDDYKTYEFQFKADVNDLVEAGCSHTDLDSSDDTIPAIQLTTTASEGFDLRTLSGTVNNNVSANVKANEVWLYTSAGETDCEGFDSAEKAAVNIFYKNLDSPARVKFYGSVVNGTANTVLFRLNVGNTKDDNMRLRLAGISDASLNLSLFTVADTAGDLHGSSETLAMKWGLTSNKTKALGATLNTEEANELIWQPAGKFSAIDLGTKDEDHRLAYGTIVVDPKGQSSSDKVKLLMPSDLVKANILIKGTNAKVTSGSTAYVPTKISPVNKAASAVTSPTSFNLIVVGGPCANPL